MQLPFRTARRLDPDTEARLEKLERAVKNMEVEWDGWYDKYRRLYARLSKRVERADSEAQEASRTDERGGGLTPGTPPRGMTYQEYVKHVLNQRGGNGT